MQICWPIERVWRSLKHRDLHNCLEVSLLSTSDSSQYPCAWNMQDCSWGKETPLSAVKSVVPPKLEESFWEKEVLKFAKAARMSCIPSHKVSLQQLCARSTERRHLAHLSLVQVPAAAPHFPSEGGMPSAELPTHSPTT